MMTFDDICDALWLETDQRTILNHWLEEREVALAKQLKNYAAYGKLKDLRSNPNKAQNQYTPGKIKGPFLNVEPEEEDDQTDSPVSP